MCVLCTMRVRRLREAVGRLSATSENPIRLSPDEKARLLSSLEAQLRDVLEVVPAGQQATRVRHDATELTAYAAPGVSVDVPRVGAAGSGDTPTSTHQEER